MGAPPTPLTPGQPAPLAPGEFLSLSQAQLTTFNFKQVGPPSNLYVMRDDQITFEVISNQASEVVTFRTRLLVVNRDGSTTIVPGELAVGITGTRGLFRQTRVLAEGYLLSATAQASVASTRGQTYVRAYITRSIGGVTQSSAMLFADYATQFSTPTWPGRGVVGPTEGPGFVNFRLVAAPGAGAEIFIGSLAFQRWRIQAIGATFTTSAAVGSRLIHGRIGTTGANLVWGGPSSAVPPSTTAQVMFTGMTPTASADATTVLVPLPPMAVLSNLDTEAFSTLTTAIAAGDAYTNIVVFLEEWLEIQ